MLTPSEKEFIKDMSRFYTDEKMAFELTRIRQERGYETGVDIRQVQYARRSMGIKKRKRKRRM